MRLSNKWQRVCITGVAGFIGSHLGERLAAAGSTVIGVDNFDPFYPRALKEWNLTSLKQHPNFTFYEGDIRDAEFLAHVLQEAQPEIVVHLAAKAGVYPSLLQPMEYYDVNVKGLLSLLECMRKVNLKHLIFASSSSVYGNTDNIPFTESDCVQKPVSPYAATKRAGELLCYTYHHLYQFQVYCLRFFTVYGPRQRPEMAIHKFIRAIDLGQPVTLYGDGTSKRDFTYIDDIIDGIISAMNTLEGFDVFNLGESRTVALIDVVRTIERYLGKKAQVEWKPFRQGDVYQTYADIQHARERFGYAPKVSFEEGIQMFCQWYKENRDRILHSLGSPAEMGKDVI